MGKQILVSPEVLRKSAQGLAVAKDELMYLIEALEQVQTALPGCWESPNTQRYMENWSGCFRVHGETATVWKTFARS